MNLQEFLNAYRAFGKAEWENVVEGANKDLSLFDETLYALAAESEKRTPVIKRALVEHHPEVARYRRRIEDFEGYPKDDMLTLSRAMRTDVMKLMELRNMAAQNLGYHDYKDLDCEQSRIHEETIKDRLQEVVETHASKAEALIEKHKMTWESWFQDLRELTAFEEALNPQDIVEKVVETFGFTKLRDVLSIHQDEQGIAGFARKFSDRDIRIAGRIIDNASDLKTFIHELSHAILYAYNTPKTLDDFLLPANDEFLANLLETVIAKKVCTQTQKWMIQKVDTLEMIRMSLSGLFELDLWNKVKTPEERFVHHYERLMPIKHPEYWSLDSFRSVDPLFIQYYPLGRLAGKNMLVIIDQEGLEGTELGDWLYDHLINRATEIELASFL